MSETFAVGDLVWAKMRGYPFWPARIEEPNPEVRKNTNKKAQFVFFFGTENYAWITEEKIKHHTETFLNSVMLKKNTKLLKNAIDCFVRYLREQNDGSSEKELDCDIDAATKEPGINQKYSTGVHKRSLEDSNSNGDTSSRVKLRKTIDTESATDSNCSSENVAESAVDSSCSSENITEYVAYSSHSSTENATESTSNSSYSSRKSVTKSTSDCSHSSRKNVTKSTSNSSHSSRKSVTKSTADGTHSSRKSVRKSTTDGTHSSRKSVRKSTADGTHSSRKRVTKSSADGTHSSRKSVTESTADGSPTENFTESAADSQRSTESPVRIDIVPSRRKFGFIGLGRMGKIIAKKILLKGHNLTVWDRSMKKRLLLVKHGAKIAGSPADLITKCDVTFCCVTGPKASKELIFGERGILEGFDKAVRDGLPKRGYVELSTIDLDTSLKINQAITERGGLYLEAPMSGTVEDAQKHSLHIIASGDRKVFSRCETIFCAICNKAFYFACEVGRACMINLILTMSATSSINVCAEVMALATKGDVPLDKLMRLLKHGPLVLSNDLVHMEGVPTHISISAVLAEYCRVMEMASQFSHRMPSVTAAFDTIKSICLNSPGDYVSLSDIRHMLSI